MAGFQETIVDIQDVLLSAALGLSSLFMPDYDALGR
jgi:hypothetical protein